MEDIFKPQSLTIGELFGNKDALYQIPRYQRPYSWGDEQLEKLWEDIREAQLMGEPNYFLGSVITAKPEETSNYLDIVDGQQRLTTLIILFCVCRDLFPDLNQQIIEKDPFAIDGKMIKSSIRFNDRFERLRLRTHSNHESDFQEFVLKDGQSTKNSKPYKKHLKVEESPSYKFQNTTCFFRTKLEELGEAESGLFINYLFNRVKIIRIDCQSVSFAIKLFQVLNDRGLDLSNSDLIKSFLIGKIHKKYDGDAELKKQFEDQFMDDWKKCEGIAIDTEETMNDLFVLYEYLLLAKNPEKSLFDELKNQFENKDPNEIIRDFLNIISVYKEKIYNSDDPVIFSFYYLKWGTYWRSILLAALKVDYPNYTELAFVLRRYYYLNWIAGYTLTKIKQTSFNLIGWIKDKKPLTFVNEQLSKSLSGETIERATNALSDEIYGEPWAKPLLFMIEYNLHENPNFLGLGDRNIQIEHILPKSYLNNKAWKKMHEIEHLKDWLNTGANLTLLSGKKNLAASNDVFSNKIKAYTGTGLQRKNDSKVTSFLMTQAIVNDYHGNVYQKEWNTDAMNDRYEWFLQQVEEILDVNLDEIRFVI